MAIMPRVVSWFRQLWKERRAAHNPHTTSDNVADQILNKALQHLGVIDENSSLWQKAISEFSELIVLPAHLKKPHVKEWLKQNSNDLKSIAKKEYVTGKRPTSIYERLIERDPIILGENESSAKCVVDIVVAVLKTALQESKDDRIVAMVQEGVTSIHSRFDELQPIPVSTRIVDRDVKDAIAVNIDVQEVTGLFGDASRVLLDWQQETAGHWIDRPELDQLYHHILSEKAPKVIVLLGSPGTGKSAVLARLGKKLMEEEVILLAIKADHLPRTIDTHVGIDKWVGCPVVESLGKLAETHRVVVLIDQLDALAELMDQHTDRLSALLRLVQSIRGIPNLSVLLSCREFEFQNDTRLRSVDADSVPLETPPWEKVSPVLAAAGVDVATLVDEQRKVLRVPQHLAVFMAHFSRQNNLPTFSTYQALLEHVIQNRLDTTYGIKTVEVAEYVATTMAKEEQLWVARGRFDRSYEAEIKNLIAAQILVLSDNAFSISFRHQTVFDFLRARSFIRDQASLASFVTDEKRQSLFVRPILWSALHYLRGSDTAIYRREFEKLWLHPELRMHVRYLLVNFLGQLSDPDERETGWLLSRLDDSEWTARILQAIAGSRGWYEKMKPRIPSLMDEALEKARMLVSMLYRATKFARDDVVALVEKYWINRSGHRALAWHVLSNLAIWDQRTVQIMGEIACHQPVDSSVQMVLRRISTSRPDLASELLFRYLSSMNQEEAQAAVNRNGWYGIEELAKKAPQAFIRNGWSWFVDILRSMGELPTAYQYSRPSKFHPNDVGESLPKAFNIAIESLAEMEVDVFLKFMDHNKNVDSIVVHRILIRGLEIIACRFPHVILDYLLGDGRRLVVGDTWNEDSQRLIAAAVPNLADRDVLRLETAIVHWKYPDTDNFGMDSPWRRFDRKKLMRLHRVGLLRSLPHNRLSLSGQRYLEEEQRALPYMNDHDQYRSEVREVVSPMSAEQMSKAKDEHIVGLFRSITDAKEYLRSLEASRAFAEFAKNDPQRALCIIKNFQAGKQERPAGNALAALGATSVSAATLISYVNILDSRGFTSEEFRTEAARCLYDVASRSQGLDDPTCALLENWMIKSSTGLDQESRNEGIVARNGDDKSTGKGRSFLWEQSTNVLPSGNFPILDALTAGYLCRRPVDVPGLLGVLERHVDRAERTEVWTAMTRYLPLLGDRPQSVKFMETLFTRYPEILNHQLGVHMIAQVIEWIPAEMLTYIVNEWIDGSWQYGPQVAGKIIALALCRDVDRERMKRYIRRTSSRLSSRRLKRELLRVGIAFTLIKGLEEPDLRSLVTPLIIRLFRFTKKSDCRLSRVLHRIGHEKILYPDCHTKELLRAFLRHPHILMVDAMGFFVDGMKSLLAQSWDPRLVHSVADTFITRWDESDQEPGYRPTIDGLIEVAFTLHNLPETRHNGLELFERLLALDLYGMNDRLRTLDRHPS